MGNPTCFEFLISLYRYDVDSFLGHRVVSVGETVSISQPFYIASYTAEMFPIDTTV